MKLETKYDLFHIFWAPRCYERLEQEKLVWDGEEWFRNVPKYEAIAKQKQIVAINVTFHENGSVHTKYGCIDFGADRNTMSSWYDESAITNYTEEEALKIAQEYAFKEETYYGN
jgi:hypothetical protein